MKKTALALSVLFSISSFAIEINEKTDYLVKKGDTLWDISEHFLKDPWEWKTLWRTNPQIENPHLIYPDDLITLSFDTDGEPVLSIERDAVEKTLNLNTKVEEVKKSISNALPPVNLNLIKEFDKNYVVSEKKFTGKVLKNKSGNIMSYSGDNIYIYDKNLSIGDEVSSLKKIKDFNGIGYLYKKTGELIVTKKEGDVFIAKIEDAFEPIKSGDLIGISKNFDSNQKITPKKTLLKEPASIIYTMDRINSSKNDIVLLDKGSLSGITPGDILKIVKKGESFSFNENMLNTGLIEKGLLFVYKVEKNATYAIIVKNEEKINIEDMVISPFKDK